MVATKRLLRPGILLVAICAMMLGYQNCAVDLAHTTPGASTFDCEPTAQQLSSFEPVLNNILQNSTTIPSTSAIGCGGCHGSTVNNSAKSVYTIFQGSTTSDPTLISKNLCIAFEKGRRVATHPQESTHGGGAYSSSDIQALITFVNANF